MVSYRATLSHISRDMWKCGIQSHNQQNINTRRYSSTQFTIAVHLLALHFLYYGMSPKRGRKSANFGVLISKVGFF